MYYGKEYVLPEKKHCHNCRVPKPKIYFKKVIKTTVKKVYYVPKVKKFTKVRVICGVKPIHRKKHYYYY